MSNQTHEKGAGAISFAGDACSNHTNIPEYSRKLLQAAQEAKRVFGDTAVPGYPDMGSLKHALEN